MGKLISALKISGMVDGLFFRPTDDGIVVQGKPGPLSEQVLTSKRFDRTRRNAREFGKVIKDAMLLRQMLGISLVKAVKHSTLSGHMNKRLHQISTTDKLNEIGFRHANAGNIQLLEGFDYNHLLSLNTALPVQFQHTLDTATGTVQFSVPGCIVRHKKIFPKEATHFQIVSCAGAVDFDQQWFSSYIAQSELLLLGKKMSALQLEHSLQAKPGQVMLHTAGIVFYKVEDGEATLLRGGALKIVQVARKEEVSASPAITYL